MCRVPNEHIRELLGHEQVGETFGRYGSSIPVSLLADSIDRVNFDSILSELTFTVIISYQDD